MRESLPLATIQDAVLEFLKGRKDTALFGEQAVNAYVDEARMTQDVDVLLDRARVVRSLSSRRMERMVINHLAKAQCFCTDVAQASCLFF